MGVCGEVLLKHDQRIDMGGVGSGDFWGDEKNKIQRGLMGCGLENSARRGLMAVVEWLKM